MAPMLPCGWQRRPSGERHGYFCFLRFCTSWLDIFGSTGNTWVCLRASLWLGVGTGTSHWAVELRPQPTWDGTTSSQLHLPRKENILPPS